MIAVIARSLTDFPRSLVTDRVTEFSTNKLTEFCHCTDRIFPEFSGWQSDRIFDWRTDRILPMHWQNFTKIDWQSDRVTELTEFYHSPEKIFSKKAIVDGDSEMDDATGWSTSNWTAANRSLSTWWSVRFSTPTTSSTWSSTLTLSQHYKRIPMPEIRFRFQIDTSLIDEKRYPDAIWRSWPPRWPRKVFSRASPEHTSNEWTTFILLNDLLKSQVPCPPISMNAEVLRINFFRHTPGRFEGQENTTHLNQVTKTRGKMEQNHQNHLLANYRQT